MGFVKEPKGIDFFIESGTLSDSDREEISLYIKEYKSKFSDNISQKKRVQRVNDASTK